MTSSYQDWTDGPFEPVSAEECFHGLVAAQAARAPEAVAAVGEGQALTYGELAARAERLADLLRARGVGPDVPVGLCLGGSPARVVGLLAILMAGGAFLPLDPGDPAERLAFLLADSGAPLVVAEARFAHLLPAALPTLLLDRRFDRETAAPVPSPGAPPVAVGPSSLAYVIYTSGSTGRPKGVLLTHGGAVSMVRETVRLLGLGPATRMFQGASAGFDASVFETLPTLAAGGCLVLGRGAAPLAGPELVRRLVEERVTTLFMAPALLETLEPGELPDVGTLAVGGDSCPAATAARWAAGRRFWNLYGPTEVTIYATAWPASERPVELERSPPIGRPIANARVQLVDAAFAPVPSGQAGELVVGGTGIARGYLGRPDLTAERFVPNPAAGSGTAPPGDRLYRTGDLARLLPSGDLEFAGRADRQVKIRGVRVEPGEVESVLLKQPGIAEAVVVAREDRPGDRRLVAYLVARPGAALETREIKTALARELIAALVPSAFVLLDRLPLLPSGKVDRRALPAPTMPEPLAAGTEEAPRGATEETLAALFCEILGLPRIGVDAGFFDLGGHSLLAARLAARVRRELGVELPMGLLFDHSTVGELARTIDASRGAAELTPLPPLVPGPRPERLPLSFPQERVWFLDRLAPGNVAYNFQAEFRLRGPLAPAVLARALSEVVRRHEVLHTRFPAGPDGQPVQVIEEPWEVPLSLWDLSALPPGARARASRELVGEEVRRPFDVDRLPLVRWRLLDLGAEEHVLLQVEHHLVHDGWSLSVLTAELTALYEAFVLGLPSPLPPPSLQYADFALWQRAFLAGEALDRQLAWWRQRLTPSPPVLALPADRPRPRAHSFRGDALVYTVPAALYQGLRRHARLSGTTLFMTMFAGFAALLARLSGQEDLAVGSGVANRRLAESERMIGMVVNTVVLRADLSGDPTFAALLAQAREVVLGAQAHQDLPFEKLVEALRPERRLAVNPLFQVLFSFHDSAMPELAFGGLTGRFSPRPNGSAKADLNIVCLPRAEQRAGRAAGVAGGSDEDLEIVWEYSGDLFDRTTAARMLTSYLTLLAGTIADPGLQLSALPLLSEAVRHQLVREWNDRAVPFPEEASVYGLFAATAAAGPDRTAAVFGADHLSYGELRARADRLGQELVARGVGVETPVALYLPRSPEMVVATLAVLAAGGFYVPLDPSHPAERQRLLLEDLGEPLVLTLAGLDTDLTDGTRTLCLQHIHGRTRPLPPTPGGDRLCYVIYTSGSTGKPKGVAVSHRAVLRLVFGGFAELGPGVRVGHVSNTAFDAATFELWGALLTGGTLAGLSREEALTPRGLASAFAAGRVDVLFLTATLFHQVAREDARAFGPLRAVLFGGEAADPAWVRAAAESSTPPGRLLNGYGPTESTTFAVVHKAESVPIDAASVPIGRPIGNTQAYVLDRSLRPQPIGVPGELCLGGLGLARGYLGRPERTAERFVPHPLSDRTGERLYRTGDLVRALPDGVLDLLGRLDGQVKIRGFRVELGEVEAALRRHPAVVEAAAAVRGDGGEGAERRLVGYVVLRPGERPGEILAGLRPFLKPLLPEPMIPTAFAALPALPVNANGKLDRAALPGPEGARNAEAESYVAPRTPIERWLAALWADLLRLDRVGVRDDFFALGGHSLLVTQVLSRLAREHGVEVPMRTLFEAPTVEALAAEVERRREEGERESHAPVEEEEIDAAALLSRLDQLSAEEMDALMARLANGEER